MKQEIAENTVQDTKRDDIKKVDPRNIEVEEGFNERKDYGDTLAMAHSVVEMGVIEPVIGYKKRGEDKYVLTDGHRRMAGVHLAIRLHNAGKAGFEDISKIEFIRLIPSSSDLKERLYIMAITGEGKKPLTDLEKAGMYARLIEMAKSEGKKRGDAIKEIVTKLGVSQATVYNILKINELPEEIKDAIAKNEISGSTVVTIVREIKDEAQQIKAVNDAIVHAKAQAEKEGGKSKATASNVKGLKAKSAIQKLKEVAEKLENKEVSNSRTKLLGELLIALEDKRSVNKILDLFI
jgi:ParB family chromosome partitioning protein